MEKYYPNQKQAGATMLTSDDIDLREQIFLKIKSGIL